MEKVLNKFYDWIDKIGKHNFMLLVFILIVSIVTGLYTTFSIVTSTDPSEIIDGLLTYKFILNADSDNSSITIASGSSKLLDITVSNEEKSKLKYGIYYSSSDDLSKVNLGYVKNSTNPSTGLIEGKQNYIVTIKIDNNSDSNVTINFGLSFGLENGGDLIIPDGSNLINKYFGYGTATTYIKNLYEDGSEINTVNIAGDTSKPQVHLNSTQGIMLDNNGEYRYYGASPNNYIEYNGELWRIISSSTVYSSSSDTTGSQRLRIIRADSIGYHAWDQDTDSDGTDTYTNNWETSTLNTTLNGIYYNGTSGTCYTAESAESTGTSTTCDYASGTIKGLSEEARSLIDNAVWYLGGSSEYSGLYASDYYNFERGLPDGYTLPGSDYPETVTTKLGIMYPSDYTYAADLSVCTKTGYSYEGDTTNCTGTDWLFNSDYQWLISPYSGDSYIAFYVDSSGYVRIYIDDYVTDALGVRPVAVLKSDIVITSGKGTEEDPYKISGNSFTIDNGNDYVSDKSNVELKLVSTGNAKTMCISVNTSDCSNYIDFNKTHTLDWSSEEDGEKTVYVYYKNKDGNIIASMSNTIILDSTAPTDNSLSIGDGAGLSRVLTISSTGADYMCFSNTSSESSDCTNWVSYATSYNWRLSDGIGTKTVYAFFKDIVGNISSTSATKEVTEILAFNVTEDFADTTFDTNITITGSGDYPWEVANGRFQNTNQYADDEVGDETDSISTIQFTPYADATLSFDYGVLSEENYDMLTITLTGSDSSSNTLVEDFGGYTYDDNDEYAYITGNITDISLTAGVTYTLTLTYHKDSSVSEGDDTAYIDNLIIE